MAYPFILTKLLARTGLGRFVPGFQRRIDGAGEFVRFFSDRALSFPPEIWNSGSHVQDAVTPDAIDLASGVPTINRLPWPELRSPKWDVRPHPLGSQDLREAISDRLNTDYRLALHPAENVLITHGATGALSTALDTLLNPGQSVVLFEPCSPLFSAMLQQRRARIRWVPTWMDGGHIRFLLDPLARALRGARMLILADPSHPTGGTFAPEDLEQIAWWANRSDVLVVQDDSLTRFQYDGDRMRLAMFPTSADRTLTIGSMSKGYSLPSLRVGWLAGHRQLVRACVRTQMSTTASVAAVVQQMAVTAINASRESFVPVQAELRSRRQYVFERLRVMGLSPFWPGGGFVFWLPVHGLGIGGANFAEQLLRSKKVLVSPGDLYGPGGHGYVRLSYGGDEGRLLEGLTRIAEFVAELRGPLPVARLVPDSEIASRAA